jgi:hypothetical protein
LKYHTGRASFSDSEQQEQRTTKRGKVTQEPTFLENKLAQGRGRRDEDEVGVDIPYYIAVVKPELPSAPKCAIYKPP